MELLSTKPGVQPQEKQLSVREVAAVQVLVYTGLVSSSSPKHLSLPRNTRGWKRATVVWSMPHCESPASLRAGQTFLPAVTQLVSRHSRVAQYCGWPIRGVITSPTWMPKTFLQQFHELVTHHGRRLVKNLCTHTTAS